MAIAPSSSSSSETDDGALGLDEEEDDFLAPAPDVVGEGERLEFDGALVVIVAMLDPDVDGDGTELHSDIVAPPSQTPLQSRTELPPQISLQSVLASPKHTPMQSLKASESSKHAPHDPHVWVDPGPPHRLVVSAPPQELEYVNEKDPSSVVNRMTVSDSKSSCIKLTCTVVPTAAPPP
jgi:hypothetical protein